LREKRVEVTSDSWVSLNSWSTAAVSPLAERAAVEEFNNDPLMDVALLEETGEPSVVPGVPEMLTKFAPDAPSSPGEL
jgi:hypothetical protein